MSLNLLQKVVVQRRKEVPEPVPPPVPMLTPSQVSSQIGRQPLAPVHDQGFVTHNGFISLDAFLTQLQDEAFDSIKLSMMEASIRRFHLIAADADVQLARKLNSFRAANFAEKRQALIQEHKQFMEAQASSLLTDMNASYDKLKEQQTMSPRSLFDISVDEDGWERQHPPSTVPWKTASLVQSKLSNSWEPARSPQKTAEVPKPRVPPPMPKPEPEFAMPSFWKPSWGHFTEPSTPQVPPISRPVTVEDIPDEDDIPEPVAPASVPILKHVKPAPVPTRPIPAKFQIPSVAHEPTPVWGQPWRKGQPCFLFTDDLSLTTHDVAIGKPPVSNTLSNRATKPATVTKEDVKEREEVSAPAPQKFRPPAPSKVELDAAIDNMVKTGDFQSSLEQINWAWR